MSVNGALSYLLSDELGSGTTVAIVDAYNDPNAFNDINTYRSEFGIPLLTIGTSFKQVNQSGGSSLPRNNGGWAQEISLDLDMVSAVCPNCNILLVEASSNSNSNLYTAENYAAAHANYVSNSWGRSRAARPAPISISTIPASSSPSARAIAATTWSTRRLRPTSPRSVGQA